MITVNKGYFLIYTKGHKVEVFRCNHKNELEKFFKEKEIRKPHVVTIIRGRELDIDVKETITIK
jgi:hypothetical protein